MSDPLCTCSGGIGADGKSFHRTCARCLSGGYEWRLVPKSPPPRPTSEPGVGNSPLAMLGDERREEPVNASSSSPVLVPMDAERIAALRRAHFRLETDYSGDSTYREETMRHADVLRAILRDAGADE